MQQIGFCLQVWWHTWGADSILHKTPYCKISLPEGPISVVRIFPIALKFGRCIGNTAADVPTKFQSDTNIFTPDLAPQGVTSHEWLQVHIISLTNPQSVQVFVLTHDTEKKKKKK